MLKSLRSRMTLLFVLLLIPFLFCTSYLVVLESTNAAQQEAQKAFNTLKDRAVKQVMINGTLTPDWKTKLGQLSEGTTFRQNEAAIVVRDRDGYVWGSTFDKIKAPDFMKTPRQGWPKGWRENWRTTAPGPIGPPDRQMLVVVVAKRKPIQSNLPSTLFGLSVVVIGAAAAGTWFMVGRVLMPIRALARQTSTASAEHLTLQLESPSKDAEMIDLVDTLNGLLERVYEEAEVKGRFYAAASHELRTPLQALSGHLELALSRSRSAEEYEAVVKESYTQASRLISLTQALLFLHQVDSRTSPKHEQVNLSEACLSALDMVESQIGKRHLRVKESFQSGIQIEAAPSHAEVLARNLVENAVKYATEGGELAISLAIKGGNIVFEVANDFPEDVKIATENVFEPFYRDDTSRNSKTGGNGLGLAICRAISSANGWDVSLHQEGGIIRALVDFGPVEPKREDKGRRKPQPGLSRPATA